MADFYNMSMPDIQHLATMTMGHGEDVGNTATGTNRAVMGVDWQGQAGPTAKSVNTDWHGMTHSRVVNPTFDQSDHIRRSVSLSEMNESDVTSKVNSAGSWGGAIGNTLNPPTA